MRPELFSIGSFTVYSYGFMIAVGLALGLVIAEKRAPKVGLEPDHVFNILIAMIIGGALGGKLLYWIVEWKAVMEDPSMLLDFGNGFVIYGALFGGVLGIWIYSRIKKVSFIKYLDLAMPSVAFGQCFGRIGCFLAGCCYGKETDSWFHVVFHNSRIAPNGVPLIPTQLISAGADMLHFFILIWIAKRFKGDGQVAGFYMIFYSIGRTLIEMLRDDPRGAVGGLSTSQFISLFILILGVILVVRGGRKTKPEMAN